VSFSQEQMLELMAFADGELEGDARRHVEELLRESEEARRVVAAMGTLGEVVRAGAESRAGAIAVADGIADGVMAALKRAPLAQDPGRKVVSLAEARRSRGGVTAAIVAALAVAAGAVFAVRGKAPVPVAQEQPIETTPAALSALASAPGSASAALAEREPAEKHGVDLEEVHSVNNKVNVIFMPSAAASGAAASVVVWIDDDGHGAP
jgi:hypothetical protein